MIEKVHIPLNHRNRDICEFCYGVFAYCSAAQVLSNLPERVKIGQVKTLHGIEKKIGDKKEKFLQTGKYKGLEMVLKKQDLADDIKTLEDLKKHQDKFSARQRLELKYFEDFNKKMPREEVMKIEQLRGLDETTITAIVTYPDYISKVPTRNKNISMKVIVKWLKGRDLVADTISLGSKNFVGACRLPTCTKERFGRLSIHFVFYDQYYCAILYYTGNETFNKTIKRLLVTAKIHPQ